MKPIKVTITGAQQAMWYNTMIGKTIVVTNTSKNYYKEQGNRIIFKCDAVPIKDI